MSEGLWVERYRPQSVKEVEHHDDVKALLEGVKLNRQLPNLLLYGPAGTGKTSIILAFAKEVFGTQWRSRVLELNASDDRGIGMIRERVKAWSRLLNASLTAPLRLNKMDDKEEEMTIPPWKIIVLDEADMMTADAQSALRRVMEDTSQHTRFVLICNYVSKIIDPVASRCVKCRFQSIPRDAQERKLMHIVEAEKLKLEPDGLARLIAVASGDLRMSINLLQSAAMSGVDRIDAEVVDGIAGLPPKSLAASLYNKCKQKYNGQMIADLAEELRKDGWNVNSLMEQLTEHIIEEEDSKVADSHKAQIIMNIALSQRRLVEGGSEVLELQCVLSKMAEILV